MSYALTKPPKGSNVSGEELLQPLMQTRDSIVLQRINQTEWLRDIDNFVEGNCEDDQILSTAHMTLSTPILGLYRMFLVL